MARKKTPKPEVEGDENSLTTGEAKESTDVSEETSGAPDAPGEKEAGSDAQTETAEKAEENEDASLASGDEPSDEAADVESPDEDQTLDAESSPDIDEDGPADTPETAADPVNDDERQPEEPVEEPVKEIIKTETVVERRGGGVPMVLGGIVAGAVGFGAAYYGLPNTSQEGIAALESAVSKQISAQSEQIAVLSSKLEDTPPAIDLSGVEAAQASLVTLVESLSERLDLFDDQISGLETRLSEMEKRPMTEGASDAAVAAYERELNALQEAIAAQRAEIEAMADEAQSMEQSAEEIARSTMQRAALTRIQTALDAGTGFAPALSDLEASGAVVPGALSSVAADGVASLADLQEAFPAVARAALAESRRVAAESGEGGGFGAFLKTQLGARSLEPREGSDPDAVLSRAEAAAREGRLTDALAEVDALPEEGRAQIAAWAADVTQRLDAVAAAEALGQELK